jgi:Cyclic nucleotide-binding domain
VNITNLVPIIGDHALDIMVQNIWIERLWIRLGLDPGNISFSALAHRLIDVVLANINFVNSLALAGAALYAVTQLVRTIVPLRVIGIVSTLFFIAYGAMAGAMSTFFLYLLSLPINIVRLRQMLNLIKKARVSAQGDLSMDWLRPFMGSRSYRNGEILFRKGDVAKEMLLTVTGRYLAVEIGVEVLPGRLLGELGFIAPENRRTQTVQCIEDGTVLTISYEKLLELYFQNPEFGYYFLRLTTQRLMQDIARLEATIEANKADAVTSAKADATLPDRAQP